MQLSRLTFPLACIAAVVATGVAIAHSDAEKPRYVAENGIDEGRCDNPATPCQTIGYALRQAGKGSQVLVASGAYEVSDAADIFYIVSGAVDVRGGFSAANGYRLSNDGPTTLIGVPREYRAQLSSRGFSVVADTKGFDNDVLEQTEKYLGVYTASKTSLSAAPCVGGQSAGLDCVNTELLSRLALSSVSASPGSAADVWGFTDLNSLREYAIVGFSTGTGVFDVTDPENPVEIGFIDGQATSWRDIKVYQFFNAAENRWNAYAYVVADSTSDGLFVIDLTELPHRVFRSGAFTNRFFSAHNVFLTNIDYGTGLALEHAAPTLIVAGANNDGGRFRSFSLTNPANPQEIAVAAGANLYMHDAASTVITDSRRNQCQNETATYCELLFDFNEGSVVTWDITQPSSPVLLSETPYSAVGYTHSGWVSEDNQYLFVHDELDEGRTVSNTTVRVFSLADVSAPSFISSWVSNNVTTDHNGFVRGNRYYMSNYKRGLTILDITNPAATTEIGYLDSYSLPDNSGSQFRGAWGAYPYFPSGSIAVSDIGGGLHMIRDTSLDTPQGSFSFTQNAFGGVEGSSTAVTVSRNGGSTGSVSVDYTLVPGTADSSDVASVSGTLSWADGDSADKTITITTNIDTDAGAGLEQMLVKLIAPTGGATVSSPSVSNFYISDGNAAEIEFDRANVEVSERGFATAVVLVQRRENASGTASVDFAVSGGDATAGADFQGATSGTLSWNDGDADPKWIEFPIVDDGTGEPAEFFEVMLSNPVGANLGAGNLTRVTIQDGNGANQAPNAQAGGSQTVQPGAQVTLNGGGSNDPDGDTLSYQWSQTMGPNVTLNNATSASASFTAPSVSSDTLLRFQLEVTDPGGLGSIANVSVTVTNNSGGGFGSSGGGGGGLSVLLLALLGGFSVQRRASRQTGAGE